MKNIIALYGISNVGKSETLKIVFEKLKEDNSFILFEEVLQLTPENGDIRVIIIINNKKIGIESQGDPNSRIYSSMELFKKEKCDIIVCATRTRGETVKVVENLKHNFGYNLERIKKEHTSNEKEQQAKDNEKVAKSIVEKISNLLLH